jgi:hypothetical protein
MRGESRAGCGGPVSTAIVDREHLDILIATPAVELVIPDSQIRKIHPFVEVRQVVFEHPCLDLARVAGVQTLGNRRIRVVDLGVVFELARA